MKKKEREREQGKGKEKGTGKGTGKDRAPHHAKYLANTGQERERASGWGKGSSG